MLYYNIENLFSATYIDTESSPGERLWKGLWKYQGDCRRELRYRSFAKAQDGKLLPSGYVVYEYANATSPDVLSRAAQTDYSVATTGEVLILNCKDFSECNGSGVTADDKIPHAVYI